jgi:hypothetical protein
MELELSFDKGLDGRGIYSKMQPPKQLVCIDRIGVYDAVKFIQRGLLTVEQPFE